MAITFNLAPVPFWNFNDKSGRPLIGGTLSSFEASDHSVEKTIYSDQAGTIPYPNPITFGNDGMAGPFYFRVDDSIPGDAYFLEIRDFDGNLVRTVDNFNPAAGGGGSPITSNVDIENHLLNPSFRFFETNLQSPLPASTEISIAPGTWEFFKNGF